MHATTPLLVLALSIGGLAAPLPAQQGNPLSSPARDSIPGSYAGDGLRLVLRAEDGAYVGTLTFQGEEYPCRAEGTAKALQGTFDAGGQPFDFTAALDGNQLTLESGGTTYRLGREAPTNPLGSGAANPLGAGPTTTSPAGEAPAAGPVGSLADLEDLGEGTRTPGREWTLLVYLDGDNNLEPFALSDLDELEAGLPETGVEVLVLCDRAVGFDDTDGDWTDARLLRVTRDGERGRLASEVLARPGELNMGDPKTLAAFVGGALRAYPAPRTALVLWNHGGGWSVLATDDDAPGAEGGHDALVITETAAAVRAGLDAAGVDKLDLVGFDMCLMAQLETAVEVADVAKVMVASQAIEPGDGWPYADVLAAFGKGTLGTTRIATEIVAAYSTFYAQRGDLLSTQSAMDLAEVDRVVGALDDLLEAVDPSHAEAWPPISRSLFFAEAYADMTDIRNGTSALASVDLLDAMKRVRNNTPGFDAHDEFRAFVEAMDRFVLDSRTSPLRGRSNGVAVYAPVRSGLQNPAYAATRFAQRSRWADWLGRLHDAQAAHSEAPRIGDFRLLHNDTGQAMPAVSPLGGVSVHFSLTGDNILWTQALSGAWDEENRGVLVFNKWLVVDPEFFMKVLSGEKEVGSDTLQLITPDYVDGRNELSQELQGLRYAVSNGEDAYFATIDRSDLSDRNHFHVPVLLTHASLGELGGTLYFDSRTWEVAACVLEVPQPDGSMAYQQLGEVPEDAQVTTLFEFIGEDGQFQYLQGGTLAWGQGLSLILSADDPGSYVAAFTAETIAGASTTEFFGYEVTQSQEEAQAFQQGGQFTPDQLLGTWEWMGTPRGQNKPQSMGMATTIERHPENPTLLVGQTHRIEDGSLIEVALVVPDTRMLPNLRFLNLDESGAIGAYALYTCLYAEQNGVRLLTLKDADTGRLFGLVQRSQGEPGDATPPSADVQDPMVGAWETAEGVVFAFDGQNWEMGYYGQVVDQGTYTKNGDKVTLTSAVSGEVVEFRIRVTGKRMRATDAFGETSVLTKIQ